MTDFAIIRTVTITASMVTSSNVSELDSTYDPPAWNGATAYEAGDLVGRTATHKVYQRRSAGTTGTAPEDDPTNWLEAYSTNKFAMFDLTIGVVTRNVGTIEQGVTPSSVVNAVSVHGVVGDSVTVERGSWSVTKDMTGRSDAVFTGLPFTLDEITITVDAGSGVAECAECFFGLEREIGSTEAGASVGIRDYSTKDTDEFGATVVTERAFAKRTNVRLLVDNDFIDELQRMLASLRATIAVYVGNGDDLESLIVAGFYRSFEIAMDLPDHSYVSLEIEGVT